MKKFIIMIVMIISIISSGAAAIANPWIPSLVGAALGEGDNETPVVMLVNVYPTRVYHSKVWCDGPATTYFIEFTDNKDPVLVGKTDGKDIDITVRHHSSTLEIVVYPMYVNTHVTMAVFK